MPTESLHFSCPACGGKKTWKPDFAGKRAKCPCGHIFTVPLEPPTKPAAPVEVPASFEDAFAAAAAEIDPDAPIALATTPSSPPGIVIRPATEATAVAPATRKTPRSEFAGIPHRKPLQREASPEAPRLTPLRDFALPGILIAVGLALCLFDATYTGEGDRLSLSKVIGPMTINIAASLGLAIGAVFAASAMGGVAFVEPVPLIIYKLAAVALTGALGSITMHYVGGINGDMANVFVGIGCCFLLFVLLFRMAMSDRVVCVMLIFIIRTAIAYAAFKFMGAKTGSSI